MENNRYLKALALMGVGGAHPGGLHLTKHILAREEINANMTILDAGCGTGQTAAYIADQFQCRVTALDNSEMMLEKARERFSGKNLPIDIRQGNIENLSYRDDLFNMVVFESVLAFTDISRSIAECKRVLKPDGVFYAIEMVLEKKLPEHELKPIIDFYGIARLLTEAEWRDLFSAAGFWNVRAEVFNLPFGDVDLDNTRDFLLSETIDDDMFDILQEHEQLTALYAEQLGFRIFRCSV
ncbi:class I SAM-dependent methyltransferase [Lentibacillus sp. CBA3610]|uniref:class I SAM-dependent methyltransferase n=1 Tax=Lentibacillus sp. CBA3610 TaxID=2518176 RepID=UPI00159536AD|nr:class I SAM-dependent methyltransferase [Lentibacillus sp. CBA3610]QKY68835.1 class I SAM-dependent methyltransferase [Lentibacillus sp. CBA3610]